MENKAKFSLLHEELALDAAAAASSLETTVDSFAEDKIESWASITWRRFKKDKLALASLMLLLILALIAVFAPILAPYDPVKTVGAFDAAPTGDFLLGTDDVGRDNLSRLIYGSRISLIVGIGSVIIYTIIGITLGLISGYFGGIIDNVIMRITEVFMAYPRFMIILVIVSLIGPNMWTVMFVMGLMGWPPLCRLVRGEVLKIKTLDYVSSAVVTGYSPTTIVFQHILPNAMSPILVNFTFGIALAILTEASLSFLGLGVQPPTASWGNMLTAAQSLTVLTSEPWRWIPPGLCILVTVLAVNFLGDGLNDAIGSDAK